MHRVTVYITYIVTNRTFVWGKVIYISLLKLLSELSRAVLWWSSYWKVEVSFGMHI